MPWLVDVHHIHPANEFEEPRGIANERPLARDGKSVDRMNPVNAVVRPVRGQVWRAMREQHRPVAPLIHHGNEVVKGARDSAVDKPERFGHMEDLHEGS